MPRLFTTIVLPLLLAPSLGVAQRLDIRAQSTSVTRLSSGQGTRGHFWAGGVIGTLIRSDRSSSASFNDHRISVGPRLDAPGFTVDVRF